MLDTPQKKILAASAVLFFLISGAAVFGFLPISIKIGDRAAAPTKRNANAFGLAGRQASYDELIGILKRKKGNPAAERFARSFLDKSGLYASWKRLKQTKDVKAFGQELSRSDEFQDVIEELDGDPGFAELLTDVVRRPVLTGILDAFKSGGGTFTPSGGGLAFVQSGGFGSERGRGAGRVSGTVGRNTTASRGQGRTLGGVRGRRGGRGGQFVSGRRVRDISTPKIGPGGYVGGTNPSYASTEAGEYSLESADSGFNAMAGDKLDGDGIEEQSAGNRGSLLGASSSNSAAAAAGGGGGAAAGGSDNNNNSEGAAAGGSNNNNNNGGPKKKGSKSGPKTIPDDPYACYYRTIGTSPSGDPIREIMCP